MANSQHTDLLRLDEYNCSNGFRPLAHRKTKSVMLCYGAISIFIYWSKCIPLYLMGLCTQTRQSAQTSVKRNLRFRAYTTFHQCLHACMRPRESPQVLRRPLSLCVFPYIWYSYISPSTRSAFTCVKSADVWTAPDTTASYFIFFVILSICRGSCMFRHVDSFSTALKCF